MKTEQKAKSMPLQTKKVVQVLGKVSERTLGTKGCFAELAREVQFGLDH